MAVVPAGTGVFSDLEEEFFRVGTQLEDAANDEETWDDLDADYQPTTILGRLFKRPERPATEPSFPALRLAPRPLRAPTPLPVPRIEAREEDDGDEWEWELALARARIAANEAV